METSNYIETVAQKGRLKLVGDLLSTLKLPSEGVLRYKSDTEYIFFSKEKWEVFIQAMATRAGFSSIDNKYTRAYLDFNRQMQSRAKIVSVQENVVLTKRSNDKQNLRIELDI